MYIIITFAMTTTPGILLEVCGAPKLFMVSMQWVSLLATMASVCDYQRSTKAVFKQSIPLLGLHAV